MGKGCKHVSQIVGCGEIKDIKVSLICTLKNEESSIKEFLDSLLSQSRPPDEIIIVDGGSIDRTVEIIKSYIEKGAPIKLIVKNGVNIAEGRNIAIKNAEYDIIASTDAGCRLDKDWLKNLVRPFEEDPSVDVVAGWYEADARTEFEKCVAELTYPKLENVLKNPDKFLPSSRSVAFKKKCWEKVGGYPEWLYTAEDTLFDLNLKKAGCKFAFAPHAVVYWRVRPNLRAVFKQHYLYAKGNGEAGLLFNYRLLFIRYTLGGLMLILGFVYPQIWIALLICILGYLLVPLVKNKQLRNFKVLHLVPIIILILDFARIVGCLTGIFNKTFKFSFSVVVKKCKYFSCTQ